MLQWRTDRAGLFSKTSSSLYFSEFRTQPDSVDGDTDSGDISYRVLYRQPDRDTAYCIVTNGGDDAVVYINESLGGWYLIGVFRLLNLGVHLDANGFTPYQDLRDPDYQLDPEELDENSDVSDYWNRYDNSVHEQDLQDPVDARVDAAQPVSSRDETRLLRVLVRSHTVRIIRDIYALYHDLGLEDIFCQDILATYEDIPAPDRVFSQSAQTGAKSAAHKHMIRSLASLKQFHEQLFLDPDAVLDDIELALVEINPSIFKQTMTAGIRNLHL